MQVIPVFGLSEARKSSLNFDFADDRKIDQLGNKKDRHEHEPPKMLEALHCPEYPQLPNCFREWIGYRNTPTSRVSAACDCRAS